MSCSWLPRPACPACDGRDVTLVAEVGGGWGRPIRSLWECWACGCRFWTDWRGRHDGREPVCGEVAA